MATKFSTGPAASPEYRMRIAPKKREPARLPQTVRNIELVCGQ